LIFDFEPPVKKGPRAADDDMPFVFQRWL